MYLDKPGTRINAKFIIAIRENGDSSTELLLTTGETVRIFNPLKITIGDDLVVQEP